MKHIRLISGALSVLIAASSLMFHANAEKAEPMPLPETVSLDDVFAISDFLFDDTYADAENILDLDGNGIINAIDLTLAKAAYLNTLGLENLCADKSDILLGEEETVTFTVHAVNCETAPVLYDGSGNAAAKMSDSGTNGDEAAGDGIFTAQLLLKSDDFKNEDYYAAAGAKKSNSYRICFYRKLTETEATDYLSLLKQMSEIETYEDACAFLSESETAVSYTADDTNRSIWYETAQHACGIWEEVIQEEGIEGRGIYALPKSDLLDYDAVKRRISTMEFTPAHPEKTDIIALCPYQTTGTTPLSHDDFSNAASLMEEALNGTPPKVVTDANVTIEQMKRLSDYGAILINSHGGNCNGTSFFAIGEYFVWNDPKQISMHSADLTANRILGTTDYRVAVTPKFFEHYYAKGNLDNSFWYLGACHCMDNSDFASVLRNYGAAAVVGFKHSVHIPYDRKSLFEMVINGMILSADTVKGSYEESKRVNGETDFFLLRADAELRYIGDPDFRLVSSVFRPKYKLFDEGYTWTNAKKMCEQYGGHLAVITSEEEEQLIEDLVNTGNRNSYWLGGEYSGLIKSKWKWITGEAFEYTNWAINQPDHNYETCLMIYRCDNPAAPASTKLKWNNLAENGTFRTESFFGLDNFGFICEFED